MTIDDRITLKARTKYSRDYSELGDFDKIIVRYEVIRKINAELCSAEARISIFVEEQGRNLDHILELSTQNREMRERNSKMEEEITNLFNYLHAKK